MIAAVRQADADAVSFGGAQGGAGDAPVVRPRGVYDARDDFDIFIDGHNFILAQRLSIGKRGDSAEIEVSQNVGGIKTVFLVVHLAGCSGYEFAIMVFHLNSR